MTIEGETRVLERAVPRARDAEPDRVRGHVSAARGAARPLPRCGSASATRAASTRSRCSRGGSSAARTRSSCGPVVDAATLIAMQQALEQVHVSDAIEGYIVDLVTATRDVEAARCRREPARQPRAAEALAREGGARRPRLRRAGGREGDRDPGARAPADAAARAVGAARARRGRRRGGARDGADAARRGLAPRRGMTRLDSPRLVAVRRARCGRAARRARRSAASSSSRSRRRSRSPRSPAPRSRAIPQLTATLALDRERALEGEDVPATVELSSPVGADRVDVFLPLHDGAARAGGQPARRARSRPASRARSS